MRHISMGLAILIVLSSSLGCLFTGRLPDIDINVPDIEVPDVRVPTMEVGEMIEETKSIPLQGESPVDVSIMFGAGEINLSDAAAAGQLLTGDFRYNVSSWAPEVTFEDGELRIRQGGDEGSWGIPSSANMHNEWDLAFANGVPMNVNLTMGAGNGHLDLSGLQLTRLEVNAGAGDVDIRCDAPNSVVAEQFTLRTGAARAVVTNIGNVGASKVTIQGGAGDIELDFGGDWRESAEVGVVTGVGALTLRLPDSVGARVEIEGLTTIDNEGLRKEGDAYVNAAWGQSAVQLSIDVKAGVGSVRLVPVAD